MSHYSLKNIEGLALLDLFIEIFAVQQAYSLRYEAPPPAQTRVIHTLIYSAKSL
jgi:hypothetical protein